MFECKQIVKSQRIADELAQLLVASSAAFSFLPLPDGEFEFTFRKDREKTVACIVHGYESRFAAFKASGKATEDIGAVACDEGMIGHPGRIYYGGLWIEDASHWSGVGRNDGKWWTLAGNGQFQSDDLDNVERWLFEYAESEGLIDELMNQKEYTDGV